MNVQFVHCTRFPWLGGGVKVEELREGSFDTNWMAVKKSNQVSNLLIRLINRDMFAVLSYDIFANEDYIL